MRLSEVIVDLGRSLPGELSVRGDASVEITRVDYDSRSVEPGSLFCCLPGTSRDGHDFASEAVERGAVALVVERPLGLAVTELEVADARHAMALAAAAVWGHPSDGLAIVGITGTNGKTTVTQLLAAIFEEANRSARVIGTLTGARTTPEAPDLQHQLATWRDDGVELVAMEVSSHALVMHRVDGTRFRVAVFTNLSRDHLDFHGTMEAYFEAKARLLRPDLCDAAVVNVDSAHGRLLRDAAEVPTTGYGLDLVSDLTVTATESRFTWRDQRVHLHLGGAFNVSNALAAAETAVVLGFEPAVVAAGLSRPVVVPGRFESIDEGQAFSVIVDYAHTPDGLEQVLSAARAVVGDGEVTVVFGCGGDRDPSKRPLMGEVAAQLADRVVLTADNSRGEQTGAIIAAVKQGYDRTNPRRGAEPVIEPDRRRAIALAVGAAGPGDVVVVAGKGHETTQTIGDRVEPFDDRVVVRDELARLRDQSHEAST